MSQNGAMESVDGGPEPRPIRVDGSVRWLEETVVEPTGTRPRPRRQSSVLGAAMIAVGEILEPEKTRVDIESHAEAPSDPSHGLPFELDFGDLPELD